MGSGFVGKLGFFGYIHEKHPDSLQHEHIFPMVTYKRYRCSAGIMYAFSTTPGVGEFVQGSSPTRVVCYVLKVPASGIQSDSQNIVG